LIRNTTILCESEGVTLDTSRQLRFMRIPLGGSAFHVPASKLMRHLSHENRDRLKSACAVALFHGLIGYALLTSLGFQLPAAVSDEMKLIEVLPDPPPPPAEPDLPEIARAERVAPKDPEGAASPANLRNTPTQIVAPEPVVKLPVPPPIPAAPVAGQGNVEAAGAADKPGPGTGAGGEGDGLGSGRFGNGTGGGGGGRATPARWLSGAIHDEDFPRSEYHIRGLLTVNMRFTVSPRGRVDRCQITRSSGNRRLDEVTCRLIMRRFRYRPALDPAGRPMEWVVQGSQEWDQREEPPPIDIEPTIPDDE
jgi:protein TonB